ncbi:cold-shock protein [Rhizomonospora bruguierae]|uniref:cold-shock protein n=1 Tax=Rhizomonospora bruguierae TaxID=1581705 RepID=UPI001BD0B499|nr:cold shock domain-containing protein [Micromonospora sp. NBRC 107566]
MATGRIIRFSKLNGYGFIEADDGGEDVFVHMNDVGEAAQILQPGMRVEYNTVMSERGLRATDLRVIPSAHPAPVAPSPAPSAPRPAGSTPARAAGQGGAAEDDDDSLIEVLGVVEYEREITDVLIDTISTVTAAEIVEIRRRLVKAAADRGWIE